MEVLMEELRQMPGTATVAKGGFQGSGGIDRIFNHLQQGPLILPRSKIQEGYLHSRNQGVCFS